MIEWSRFVDIVQSHQRFVLTAHIRPDGDSLGSEMAMVGILESLGKDVVVCNAFPVPPNLRFLDTRGKFKQWGVDFTDEDFADREVLIILDTSAWAQLGELADVIRGLTLKKVVIDHHVSQDDLSAEMFKNPEAEATGRLVIDAADQLGVELTPEIAIPAYVALATDTGWFRFASTTADTLWLAARLVESGAVPDTLYRLIYENDSHARLQLIGRTLARSVVELNGRLIHTWIGQKDFIETGAISSDSEDVVNMTLSVNGTQMAVILVEQATGGYKVSLRSRCSIDCAKIAGMFGGGGHKKAAGAFFNEPLESAQKKILGAVRAAMEHEPQ
jgi:phosphoesterase RecJ-like protein